MRYRPFDRNGKAVSAVSLVLDDARMRDAERGRLVCAALEAGMNGFELRGQASAAALALGAALAEVGRAMAVVMLRVEAAEEEGREPDAVEAVIQSVLSALGTSYLDAVLIEAPPSGAPAPEVLASLNRVRSQGHVGRVGLASTGRGADARIATGEFGLLATRFSARSGWPERNRIKAAVQQGMTVLAQDFEVTAAAAEGPEDEAPQRPRGLARLFRRPDPRQARAYDFMRATPGWTAPEIALAFTLTEPSLSSVLVHARTPAELERLAAVTERELPTSVAAQIEMARFAALEDDAA